MQECHIVFGEKQSQQQILCRIDLSQDQQTRLVPKQKRTKLEDTGIEMKFLGYDENAKAYRCYNSQTGKVIISRDVRFCSSEEVNYVPVNFSPESCNINQKSILQEENAVEIQEEENEEEIPETQDRRISKRVNKGVPPRRLIDKINVTKEIKEPRTYKEAIESDEREHWIAAMQEELESHEANGTWELVDLPVGKTAVGGKWVFKAKTGVNGEIERYKARFVAQGFSQKYGVDYDEVFAPVVMHTTFRTMLSIAARRKMIVHHIDVKTAFLNGKLNETIYMKPPQGYESNSKVCLLKKSIYGLRQAARSWNSTLHEALESADFQQSYNDPCLYSKKVNNEYCYVIVYVDDLLVTCINMKQLAEIETVLKYNFDIRT